MKWLLIAVGLFYILYFRFLIIYFFLVKNESF